MYLYCDATDLGAVATFGPLWAVQTRLPERAKRFVHVKVQIYRLSTADVNRLTGNLRIFNTHFAWYASRKRKHDPWPGSIQMGNDLSGHLRLEQNITPAFCEARRIHRIFMSGPL